MVLGYTILIGLYVLKTKKTGDTIAQSPGCRGIAQQFGITTLPLYRLFEKRDSVRDNGKGLEGIVLV